MKEGVIYYFYAKRLNKDRQGKEFANAANVCALKSKKFNARTSHLLSIISLGPGPSFTPEIFHDRCFFFIGPSKCPLGNSTATEAQSPNLSAFM